MITTSSSAIRLSSFVSPPSTVSILLYQETSIIKTGFKCLNLLRVPCPPSFCISRYVHIQSTKAASRTAYHASSAILPAFRHDPHPLPSLQLADHSKRIFEDPPAPTLFKLCLGHRPVGQS